MRKKDYRNEKVKLRWFILAPISFKQAETARRQNKIFVEA
jgi:hypothetical protein